MGNLGQLGIGRLIRDHSSGVLRAFSSLAIEAEILALLEELLLAKTLSISNFLIEGDSIVVISQAIKKERGPQKFDVWLH